MNDLAPIASPETDDGRRHYEDVAGGIHPGKASRMLFWVVVGFFALAFAWAALAEVDRTVRGMGRVVSSSQLQVVSTLEGGVVEAIDVRTGQLVRAGETLLRLDPTESDANLGSTSATAEALGMKIARLTAEVEGRAPRYPAPADAEAARQMQVERALYASRQANQASLLAGVRAQLARANQAVREAEAVVASADSASSAAQSELAMVRPLVEQGIEPRLTLVRAETAASTAAGDYARARASLGSALAAVDEARANLNRASQEWREQAAADLAVAQAENDARRSSLPALRERVDRTTVRAPIEGKVNRVLVTTRGSAVSPGQALVEIVPSRDGLLIEARIVPQDIASVRMGQIARVGITAYDQSIFGALDGRVVTISPDSVVEEQTGEIYYTVQIRADRDYLSGPGGQRLQIGTGMLADVALLGDKRTVLQYLFSPISRLKERAFRE